MGHDLMEQIARRATFERVLRTIVLPNPAAGADFVFTVPGGSVWRPIAVRGLLTTSAAVANRVVTLAVLDTAQTLMSLPAPSPQVASQVNSYTWAHDFDLAAGAIGALGAVATGLPELALPAGYTVRSSSAALDAADQWSTVTLFVEEALSQPEGTHAIQAAAREQALLRTQLAAEGAS